MSEPHPEQERGTTPSAANQQMVRPDGSGPWAVGSGGSTWPPEGGQQLAEMTKAELIEEAEKRGVDVDATARKDEIREALEG